MPKALPQPEPTQRNRLGEAVATLYASEGGRFDGPGVGAARGVALAGSTVAPAAEGLNHGVPG